MNVNDIWDSYLKLSIPRLKKLSKWRYPHGQITLGSTVVITDKINKYSNFPIGIFGRH